MKKIILIALVLPLLFSCSKKKGCNVKDATNYDEMVVIDDGSCIFGTVAFYASATHLNGRYISNIEILLNNSSSLGSFRGVGGSCDGGNSVILQTDGENYFEWASIITFAIDTFNPVDSLNYYHHDSLSFRMGEITNAAAIPCTTINALN